MRKSSQRLILLRRGLTVEYLSVLWMLIEATGAVVSGLLTSSLALLAFGGDSFIELLSSFAVLRLIRSLMKRDGQSVEVESRKIEWVATILLFSLIPVIGLGLVFSVLTGIEPESSLLGISIAAGAVIIMPALYLEKKRIGRATDCRALSIDAIESLTCFLMSVAVLLGLLVNYLWRISWIDYVAATVILIFVIREAYESVMTAREKA